MARMAKLSLLGASGAAALAMACGAETLAPPASGDDDAAMPDAGGDGGEMDGGAGDDASVCGDIVNNAPSIEPTQVASDPPTPSGGVIMPGTYFETAFFTYTGVDGGSGPTGLIEQATLTLTSDSYAGVVSDTYTDMDRTVVVAATGTYSSSGTTIKFEERCPMALLPVPNSYSATANTVTFISSGSSTTMTDVAVYTLQP